MNTTNTMANVEEASIEEQMEEIMSQIQDLTKNGGIKIHAKRIAELGVKYSELETQKGGTEKPVESIDSQMANILKKLEEARKNNADEKETNILLDEFLKLSKQKETDNKNEEVDTGETTESVNDKIKKFRGKKVLSAKDKEALRKLRDEREKEREQKNEQEETKEEAKEPAKEKEKSNKKGTTKDPLIQSLMDKLNGINENRQNFGDKKIGTITTNALPWIPLPHFKKTSEDKDGVKSTKLTLSLDKLTYKARVRHHRLNRVAKKFNSMGNKQKKGLNYIAAMCKKSEGGKPMAAMIRGVRGRLDSKDVLRNPDVFTKKVEEQKKIFIDDITQGVTREEEVPVINAIKQRIDFFAQEYYLKYAEKLLGAIPTPKK